MDENRWSIERSFGNVWLKDSEGETDADRFKRLQPEQADSLEPLLNPLPTMSGAEIAEALDEGRCVEVLSGLTWTTVADHSWSAAPWLTRSGLTLVARMVDPEPEPEPETEKVGTLTRLVKRCGVTAQPQGFGCSLAPNHAGAHVAHYGHDQGQRILLTWTDPAPVSDDPLPEGVRRVDNIDGTATLIARGDAVRLLPTADWKRKPLSGGGQGAWQHGDNEIANESTWYEVEVRPVSVPDTEQVPLHKLEGRRLAGCDWYVGGIGLSHDDKSGDAEWIADDGNEGRCRRLTLDADGMVTVLREEQADRT